MMHIEVMAMTERYGEVFLKTAGKFELLFKTAYQAKQNIRRVQALASNIYRRISAAS